MVLAWRRKKYHARRLDAATLKAVRAFLDRIAVAYPVRGAVLFGGRARGKFRDGSDADVAVLLHAATGKFTSTNFIYESV